MDDGQGKTTFVVQILNIEGLLLWKDVTQGVAFHDLSAVQKTAVGVACVLYAG